MPARFPGFEATAPTPRCDLDIQQVLGFQWATVKTVRNHDLKIVRARESAQLGWKWGPLGTSVGAYFDMTAPLSLALPVVTSVAGVTEITTQIVPPKWRFQFGPHVRLSYELGYELGVSRLVGTALGAGGPTAVLSAPTSTVVSPFDAYRGAVGLGALFFPKPLEVAISIDAAKELRYLDVWNGQGRTTHEDHRLEVVGVVAAAARLGVFVAQLQIAALYQSKFHKANEFDEGDGELVEAKDVEAKDVGTFDVLGAAGVYYRDPGFSIGAIGAVSRLDLAAERSDPATAIWWQFRVVKTW